MNSYHPQTGSSLPTEQDERNSTAMSSTPFAVLGGIVERGMPPLTGASVADVASASPPDSLRPIQSPPPSSPSGLTAISAVLGQGFPRVEPGKHYGRRLQAPPHPNDTTTKAASTTQISGLSAHVQPEDGTSGGETPASLSHKTYRTVFTTTTTAKGLHHPPHALSAARSGASGSPSLGEGEEGENATESYIAVGGGASVQVAHQWTSEMFRQLITGFYTHPLPEHSQAWLKSFLVSSVPTREAATDEDTVADVGATGENFFRLLFQCLRSTVRRHQDIGLQVLLLHLDSQDAADLRERCVHGPDCASFLFFLISLVASAGQPMLCYRAAQCLVWLLPVELSSNSNSSNTAAAPSAHASTTSATTVCDTRVSPLVAAECAMPPFDGLLSEVLGEIGAPLADVPDADHTENEAEEGREEQGGDTPFAELSELLRGGEDARSALEKMNFTTRVLMALPSILSAHEPLEGHADAMGAPDVSHAETTDTAAEAAAPARRTSARHRADALVARLLLCGGAGSCSPKAVTVLAESHTFRRWVETIVSDIVLGQRDISTCVEVLTLLYRIAHVPSAAATLLRASQGRTSTRSSAMDALAAASLDSLYETWTLFFTYVLTTNAEAVINKEEATGVMLSVLLLRELARHGHRGEALLHDLLDVLITDGLRVGSAIVLEMWLLLRQQQKQPQHSHEPPPSSQTDCFPEAALATYQLLTTTTARRTRATLPQQQPRQPWLVTFAQTAQAHYLATFLTSPLYRPAAFTLLGTAVDTQEQVQKVLLAGCVLTPARLSSAFGRLSAPLQRGDGGAGMTSDSGRSAESVQWHGFLALQAAETYAAVRLIAAAMAAYPGVSRSAVLGYVASLAAKFEEGCLGMTNHAELRIQNDELATMSEVVSLLDTYGPAATESTTATTTATQTSAPLNTVSSTGQAPDESPAPPSQRHAYQHAAQVAAFFTLHGIALTKHCLDAAPALVVLVLGGSNRGHTVMTRDLSEAAVTASVTGASTTSTAAALWYAERLVGSPWLRDPSSSSSAVSRGALNPTTAASLPPSSSSSSSLSSSIPLEVLVALALCLEEGVIQQVTLSAAVSAASTAMAGAPRSWVLFPLFQSTQNSESSDDVRDTTQDPLKEDEDDTRREETDTRTTRAQPVLLAAWSRWMRQILGLHQRLKYVLGYDALLCHVAIWTLSHRELVFGECTQYTSDDVATESAAVERKRRCVAVTAARELTDLIAQLASLLLLDAMDGAGGTQARGGGGRGGSALSASAAQMLRSALQATAATESEAPLSIGAFVALIVLATQSPASAALTLVQSLLCAPVVTLADETHIGSTLIASRESGETAGLLSWLSAPVVLLLHDLEKWGGGLGSASAVLLASSQGVSWSLEDLISLFELAAPLLSDEQPGGAVMDGASLTPIPLKALHAATAEHGAQLARRWCVSMLVSGVWQRSYLAPRMQRMISSVGRRDARVSSTSTTARRRSDLLSCMEKEVLRDALETIDWRPREVWPYLEDCDDE